MPSIVDVARKAKVAPSTVSLVINHSASVRPDTRKRVESAIEQLGYVPKHRQPRADRTRPQAGPLHHLAVVYTQHAVCNGEMTALCRSWIRGIRQALAHQVTHLSIIGGLDHADRDLMFQQTLEAEEIDGVILFGPRPINGYLDRLLAADLPVVAMNRRPEADEFGCVTVDYRGGVRQAMEYLARLGHRRVGLLSSQQPDAYAAAHAAGLEAVSLNDQTDRPANRPVLPVDIPAVARQVVEQKLTCVYTGDYQAIALIQQLNALGVKVPQQVSVVGFDDTKLQTNSGQRLCSIGYDKQLMGRLAVKLLLQMLNPNRRLQSGTLVVPTHVVEGDTVAVPVESHVKG